MNRATARTLPEDRQPCADCDGIGRVRTIEVKRRLGIFWRTVVYLDDCWSCGGTGHQPTGGIPA